LGAVYHPIYTKKVVSEISGQILFLLLCTSEITCLYMCVREKGQACAILLTVGDTYMLPKVVHLLQYYAPFSPPPSYLGEVQCKVYSKYE